MLLEGKGREGGSVRGDHNAGSGTQTTSNPARNNFDLAVRLHWTDCTVTTGAVSYLTVVGV